MTAWSVARLLADLHNDIEQKLNRSRENLGHPVSKGDATEAVWIDLLGTYLPERYKVAKAHVVDSKDAFSEQLDIVIYDRQYSPLIFEFKGEIVIPAESVYAVFESKQSVDASQIEYAAKKIASVRRLHRTSLPIPSASGLQPAKVPAHIIGGLLTFESEWKPALGESLARALVEAEKTAGLDLGCVAAHGNFLKDEKTGAHTLVSGGRPATAFLLELIARLQSIATVPMVDVRAYAEWLTKS
jgi:hypothetical protein